MLSNSHNIFESRFIDEEMKSILEMGEALIGRDVKSLNNDDLRIYVTYTMMNKKKVLMGGFNKHFSGVLYSQFDKEFQRRCNKEVLTIYRTADFIEPILNSGGIRISAMLTYMPDDTIMRMVQRYKYAENMYKVFKKFNVPRDLWSRVISSGVRILKDFDDNTKTQIAMAMQMPNVVDINTSDCITQEDYEKCIYNAWVEYNSIMSQAIS